MGGFRPQIQDRIAEEAERQSSAVDVTPESQYRGFWGTIKSAAMQENLLSNLFVTPRPRIEDDFNPFEGDRLRGYEEFFDAFADVRSEPDMMIVKESIDRQRGNMRALASAGWFGITAGFAAGTLSPENFVLPLAAGRARSVATLAAVARGMKSGGKTASISSRIFMNALEGAASTSAAEVALHQTQELREGSAFAVAASSLLTGALGGIGSMAPRAIDPETRARLQRQLAFELEKGLPENIIEGQALKAVTEATEDAGNIAAGISTPQAKAFPSDRSPSTQIEPFRFKHYNDPNWKAFERDLFDRVTKANPEMSELYGGDKRLFKAIKHLVRTPQVRLALSELPTSRQVGQTLGRTNLLSKGAAEGDAAIPVEAMVEAYESELVAARFRVKEGYRKYVEAKKNTPGRVLTDDEFRKEAGKAFRRDFDYKTGDDVADPFVLQVARDFDGLAQRIDAGLREAGYLSEASDLKGTAPKHLRRYWDHHAIQAKLLDDDSLAKRLENWMGREDSEFAGDDATLKEIAQNMEADFINRDSAAPMEIHDLVPVEGSIHDRMVLLPDSSIEDFLENDIEIIFSRLVNSAAPRIELAKAYRVGAYKHGVNIKSNLRSARASTKASREELSILAQNINDVEVYRVLKSARGAETRESADVFWDLATRRNEIYRFVENPVPGTKAEVLNAKRTEMNALDDQLLQLRRNAAEQQKNQTSDYKGAGLKSDILGPKIEIGPIVLEPPSRVVGAGDNMRTVVTPKDWAKLYDKLEKQLDKSLFAEAREAESMVALARAIKGDMVVAKEAIKANIKDPKKLKKAFDKIDRRGARDLQDMRWMRQRIMGMSGISLDGKNLFNHAVDLIRNAAFFAFSGGFTIASIVDIGGQIMQFGLNRPMRHFSAMMASFDWDEAVKDPNFASMLRAAEMYGDARRQNAIWGFTDARGDSGINEVFRSTRDVVGKLNLLDLWNGYMTGIAAVMAEDLALRLAKRHLAGEALTNSEMHLLRKFRLTDEQLKVFVGMEGQYGMEARGFRRLKTKDMLHSGDHNVANAARIWQAAIAAQAHAAPGKPGSGSFPRLFDNSQIGGLLGMFRRFGSMSSQETLLAGLQRGDAAVYQGWMAMTALGGFVTLANTALRAGEKGETATQAVSTLLDDIPSFVLDSIDRGGVLGLFGDMHNAFQRGTGLGMHSLLGSRGPARFEGRNAFSTISPMAGYVEDMYTLGSLAGRGEFSSPEFFGAARDLTPLQTLFYARWIVDRVENWHRKGGN